MYQYKRYYFRSLTKSDTNEVAKCFCKQFINHEPIVKALSITEKQFLPFAKTVCGEAAQRNLSLVACESKTNKIIGFLIAQDFADEPSGQVLEEIINLPNIIPILEILGKMEDKFKQSHEAFSGHYFYIFVMAVSSDFGNKGICSQMCRYAEEVAERLGYKKIITEPTSIFSQRIFERLKYETIVEESYTSFTFDGSSVFRNINSVPSCKLVLKEITK